MLTKGEKSIVENAIREAESKTSGEIRVYVAKRCKSDPYTIAIRKFHKLKMERTALRNGVLIYICPLDKKAAIIGDKGISGEVKPLYWNGILNEMLKSCASDSVVNAICKAIGQIGELIKEKYPIQEDDINKLSDEIIIED